MWLTSKFFSMAVCLASMSACKFSNGVRDQEFCWFLISVTFRWLSAVGKCKIYMYLQQL